MTHGWWLDRTYIESSRTFEPLYDANGKQIKAASGSAFAQYGNIITRRIRWAELRAVTIGPDAPTTNGLVDDETPFSLIVGGPQNSTVTLARISGSAWEQYDNVETNIDNAILNIYSHTVRFRSGVQEMDQGMWNEMDPPPIEPEPDP